ncbi:MAG: hypothetical protein A2Z04_02620 [Chloroflexi bacterium RBG_16_57_9]|nr:MAG: hypothetical protein A2Z04_02620 [Chloroflexi bacterium RBG_16_57_9]
MTGSRLAVIFLVVLCGAGGYGLSWAQTERVSVRLEPAVVQIAPGSTFTLTLNIEHAQDLAGYEFDLVYDPRMVEVTGVTPESFLQSTGRRVIFLGPRIDAKVGVVAFGAASYGQPPGVSGEGVLASLQLRARAAGSTALKFKPGGLLFDSRANPQEPDFSGTSLNVGVVSPTPPWVETPTLTRTARPSPTGTAMPVGTTTSTVAFVSPTPPSDTPALQLTSTHPMLAATLLYTTPTAAPDKIPAATPPGGVETVGVVVIVLGALAAAGIGFWAGRRARK